MKILYKLLFIAISMQVFIGCSQKSEVAGVSAPPTAADAPIAPTNLSVSGLTSTSLTLTWTNNATDALINEIQQCTGTGCTTFADISSSPRPASTASVTITGLSSSTIYRFQIAAVNSSGTSTWLTSGDVTTSAVTVSAPTNFLVTADTSTSLSISWTDNATNETAYNVAMCTGPGCSTYTAVAGSPFPANTTSATITGLTPSTTYGFQVWASDGGSTSTILTSTDVTTAPAAPTGFTIGAVTGNSIGFSWTDNAIDETSYILQSCTGSGCTNYVAVPASPLPANSTSATVSGLSENTTYNFQVAAANSNGTSDFLTSGDVTTPIFAPTGLTVSGLSDTSLTLSWTDNSSVELIYEIDQCLGAGCTPNTPVTLSPRPANSTSVTISGLTQASVYVFSVRATNSTGSSAWATTGNVTTDPTAVNAPTGLTVTGQTQNSISISWTDNATNETGYEVQSCTGASCTTFADVPSSPYAPNTTSATISGLTPSTTYRFQVRSLTASTQSSYLVSNDITTSPAAPSAFVLGVITPSSIGFSWTDNAVDALIYQIDKCTGSGCVSYTAASNSPRPAGTTMYTESALSENTVYNFRVSAANSNGTSNYLMSGNITTLMAPPTNLTVTAISDTTVALSWTNNSPSQTGVNIEKCTGSGCVAYAAIPGSPLAASTIAATVSSLSPNTTYRFEVGANGAVPSTFINTTDVTTAPAAPTGFTNGVINATSVSFSWTDNDAGSATSYLIGRCTGAGCSSFTALATLAAGSTSYTDSSVNQTTTYVYSVQAANSNGNSASLVSGNISTPTAPITALACTSPHNVTVDSGQKGVTAASTRGLYADVKYIPSGTGTGVGTAAGNQIVTYSTNAGIVYYDAGALAIKYAYWNGDTFSVETVAGDSQANVFGLRLAYLSNSPNTGIPLIFWASGNAAANAGQITMAVRNTASLTTTGTWTVSAIDTTGGVSNKALEVSVSPIDQVLLAYQATTVPAANVARAVLCSSNCNVAGNYLTMGVSDIAAATAGQIKMGAGWCNMGSGFYNPAVTYGDAADARWAICRPGTNTLTTCQAAGGWTINTILATAGLLVTDTYMDANMTNDVPKAIVKDATNVKGYKGNAGCQTATTFATTAGTFVGSSVANTANSFYKMLKQTDYNTQTNERYIVVANDGTTDVGWTNTTSSDPSNTTWNAFTSLQTVTLNAAGTFTGGADINMTTGQITSAYGTLTGNTFNITAGIIDNYTAASNNAANIYYAIPVDTSGTMQLNAAPVGERGQDSYHQLAGIA